MGPSLRRASSCLHTALWSVAETALGTIAMMPEPSGMRWNSHIYASTPGMPEPSGMRWNSHIYASTPGMPCTGPQLSAALAPLGPAQQQRALHRAADANARRPPARHPAQAAGATRRTCCHAGTAAWPDHCCCPRPCSESLCLSSSRSNHRRAMAEIEQACTTVKGRVCPAFYAAG